MRLKLTIDLDFAKSGEVIELKEDTAKQFILKGWAKETTDEVKPEPAKPKAERQVVSRKIPKG